MERGEPLDRAERRISRVDRVDERTTNPSYKHVLFKGSYNGYIVGDVAASHASIAWRRGTPEINQARALIEVLKRTRFNLPGGISAVRSRSKGRYSSVFITSIYGSNRGRPS